MMLEHKDILQKRYESASDGKAAEQQYSTL